jgi:hypothetical protein
MAAGASGSGAIGCLVVFGIAFMDVVIIAAMIAAGAGLAASIITTVVATGMMSGFYLSSRETKAAKARALARSQAEAAAAAALAREQAAYAEQQRQRELEAAERKRQLEEAEVQRAQAAARRFAELSSRYGEELAKRIVNRRLWVGCTTEILVEMLGHPSAIDEKVLKTKVKRTFKYFPTGANRYSLRVMVDNDEVVGWEDKND